MLVTTRKLSSVIRLYVVLIFARLLQGEVESLMFFVETFLLIQHQQTDTLIDSNLHVKRRHERWELRSNQNPKEN